jgi:hypothetical protein
MNHNFNEVIEKVFELPMEEKLELIDILEHHIAEGKREEIAENYIKSIEEDKSGGLNFSSDIETLKKML